MALSRAGRIREAEGTLKLAGHYRALADAVGVDEEEADACSEEEIERRVFVAVVARGAEDFERAKGWVHSALCGEVSQLPGWATDKDFLADTLYPDMWYRHGGIGTGICGHYGPGPADYLVENGGDGVRPRNLRAQYPTLVSSDDPKDGAEDGPEDWG